MVHLILDVLHVGSSLTAAEAARLALLAERLNTLDGVTARSWPTSPGGLHHEHGDVSSQVLRLETSLAEGHAILLPRASTPSTIALAEAGAVQAFEALAHGAAGRIVASPMFATALSPYVARSEGALGVISGPLGGLLSRYDHQTAADLLKTLTGAVPRERVLVSNAGALAEHVDFMPWGRLLVEHVVPLALSARRRDQGQFARALVLLLIDSSNPIEAAEYLSRVARLGTLAQANAVVFGTSGTSPLGQWRRKVIEHQLQAGLRPDHIVFGECFDVTSANLVLSRDYKLEWDRQQGQIWLAPCETCCGQVT